MSDEEKAIREKQSKASEGLLNSIKDALDGKVADVKLSTRLKSHPVCFSAGRRSPMPVPAECRRPGRHTRRSRPPVTPR